MNIFVLDIGGTFIKYGVLSDGVLTRVDTIPTEQQRGPEALAAHITALAQKQPECTAVGISFASQVDFHSGIITSATETFPGFSGFPLRDRLEQALLLPTAVDNDVNCAAIAEASFGAMRGCKSALCLTYGTGIGAALMLDGHLHYGSTCAAGEVGHITTHGGGRPCSCGRLGCYEQYASVTALTRAAQAAYGHPLSGRDLCTKWERGDALADALMGQWVEEVVYGLSSCIHTLNPDCLVLGGGIMENNALFALVKQRLLQDLMPNFKGVQVKQAQLGNHAGMIGAGIIALRRLQSAL